MRITITLTHGSLDCENLSLINLDLYVVQSFFFRNRGKIHRGYKNINMCITSCTSNIWSWKLLSIFVFFSFKIVLVLCDMLSLDINQSIKQTNQKLPVLASDRHGGEGYDVRDLEHPFSQTILERVLRYLYFENSKSLW